MEEGEVAGLRQVQVLEVQVQEGREHSAFEIG